MTASRFQKSKWLVLICVGIGGGYLGWRSISARQFQDAIERKDFTRAERLWNWGARGPATDPYVQFMRIRARLQAINGVQVTDWKIGKLQSINNTNRYAGLLDIKDSWGEYGIGLEWQGEKWLLKINPHLPKYVKEALKQ